MYVHCRKGRVCIYYSDDLADWTIKNIYFPLHELLDVREIPFSLLEVF